MSIQHTYGLHAMLRINNECHHKNHGIPHKDPVFSVKPAFLNIIEIELRL
jgi:hypothetical protein